MARKDSGIKKSEQAKMRKKGIYSFGRYKTVPIEDRFWTKVNKEGPILRHDLGSCWEWTACLNNKGYGQFGIRENVFLAHRIAWRLKYGSDPCGIICHKCDNPKCVRVDHMFVGSYQENLIDASRKGRMRSKLKRPQVLEIFDLLEKRIKHKDIARRYGVSRGTITDISRRRTWNWLRT